MFKEVFDFVMKLEGGLVLHKNETEEAETYAGIYRLSHPNWLGWTYLDNGETPPISMVEEVYMEHYWNVIKLPDSSTKSLMFEYGVNAGIAKAVKTAQLVAGVTTDGILGPKSKESIQAMDFELFLVKYNMERVKHYAHLVDKDARKYGLYLRGWVNRVLKSQKWFEDKAV